jgi:uncharacterized membrane protein YeiH
MPVIQPPMFLLLSYAGAAVFAASGALAAARQKHDVVTFAFFAALTGVGGGTLRDMLLRQPVFWIQDPNQLTVCVAVGVLVWIFGLGWLPVRALLWLDAVGISAVAMVGAEKALSLGVAPPVAVVMGVLTAAAGGIIRDVVAGEPSVLLRREIYITAVLAGCVALVLADHVLARQAAGLLGFVVALALRVGALAFGWTLPGFRGGLLAGLRRPAVPD